MPHAGAIPRWEELLPEELPFQFSVAWKNLNPLLIIFCLFPEDLGTVGCFQCQISTHHFQERKGAANLFSFPSVGSGQHHDWDPDPVSPWVWGGLSFPITQAVKTIEDPTSILLSPSMGRQLSAVHALPQIKGPFCHGCYDSR